MGVRIILLPLGAAFGILLLMGGALGQAPEIATPTLKGSLGLALVVVGGIIFFMTGRKRG